MSLIEKELKIVKIKELINKKMTIPPYQRPYSWSIKSANTLFVDTYSAFLARIKEYRLGSVILHKENKNKLKKYNIVDGQQRLTTLSILLYCLGRKKTELLKEKFSELSNNTIVINYRFFLKRVNGLTPSEREEYKNYLLEQCTVVQIVTNSEQEAFQFFDSQNSRGKELAPHDLLKSYHLREMDNEDKTKKIKIINDWESLNQNGIHNLFENYLYPLTKWYKCSNGLGYSSNKIDVFKGIKKEKTYSYVTYHKSSNSFVEQFNSNVNNDISPSALLNQFQLTQPLLAGERFFRYVQHYRELLEQIQKKIEQYHEKEEIPNKRSGDIYIRQLYECSLMFFADRFGIESLTESIMQTLYCWSYSLRLAMHAVYPQTINKYAIGQHDRLNKGIKLFFLISEMNEPEELTLLDFKYLQITSKNKSKKYDEIYIKVKAWNRWE